VSLLAPLARQHADARVIGWLDQNIARLFLPTVVLTEMVSGAAKLRRLGRMRDAEAVADWIERTVQMYAPRILPFEVVAARETGILRDRARARGFDPGFADLAIAGTALANGMLVLTRNLKHFAPLAVPALDPFATPGA
jgi:predicted nucleic acid-binding protein